MIKAKLPEVSILKSSAADRSWATEGQVCPNDMMLQNVPDNTICTLTQFLGHIIPFIHDKILVEDLEDLASL
jgi:hypothetical protein